MDVPINYKIDKSQLDRLSKSLESARKNTDKLEDELSSASKEVDDLSQSASKADKAFAGIKGTMQAIGFAMIAQQAFEFTKQIIGVRAEFQKFEAVLENTLGSKSAAQAAFARINAYVAKTPFQVDEVTAAFIKLANQGFIPTNEELTKLGDLAASTGKGFDQLTEALIDAQVGEFERLKEFGVRAQKQGDQVKFTFKGVETQVKFTADAMRNYVVGLGEVEGVTGATDKISKTLGGQISNLEDAFTNLQNTVGMFIEGPGSGFITFLTDSIQYLDDFIDRSALAAKDVSEFKVFESGKKSAADMEFNVSLLMAKMERLVKNYDDVVIDIGGEKARMKEQMDALSQVINKQHEQLAVQRALEAQQQAGKEAASALTQEQIKQIDLYRNYIDDSRVATEALNETETKKLQDAIQKLAEEQQKLAHEAFKARTEIEKVAGMDMGIDEAAQHLAVLSQAWKEAFGEDFEVDLEGQNKEFLDKYDQRLSEQAKMYKAEKDKEKEAEAAHQQELNDIRNAAGNAAYQLAGAYYDFISAKRDEELSKIQQQKDYELSLVGDNEQAKQAIISEAALHEKQIRIKKAKDQKALALFDIALNTASAVVEALPNVILAGITGGLGLAQGILVASKPIPAYNQGIKGVPGPHVNKDVVHAKLTPGEYVMPVPTVEKYRPALDAIFDHKIDPYIINNLGRMQSGKTIVVNDNSALVKAWYSRPENSIHLDKKGFTQHLRVKGMQIQRDLNRYSMR